MNLEDVREELGRLQKLFDDAGQGEYNVLALVDHYQSCAIESEELIRELRAEVAALRAQLSVKRQAGEP